MLMRSTYTPAPVISKVRLIWLNAGSWSLGVYIARRGRSYVEVRIPATLCGPDPPRTVAGLEPDLPVDLALRAG
jgi:hypothetical protein